MRELERRERHIKRGKPAPGRGDRLVAGWPTCAARSPRLGARRRRSASCDDGRPHEGHLSLIGGPARMRRGRPGASFRSTDPVRGPGEDCRATRRDEERDLRACGPARAPTCCSPRPRRRSYPGGASTTVEVPRRAKRPLRSGPGAGAWPTFAGRCHVGQRKLFQPWSPARRLPYLFGQKDFPSRRS